MSLDDFLDLNALVYFTFFLRSTSKCAVDVRHAHRRVKSTECITTRTRALSSVGGTATSTSSGPAALPVCAL